MGSGGKQGGKGNKGYVGIIIAYVCLCIFGVVFLCLFMKSGDSAIERSTVRREALSSDMCDEYGSWYVDNWGDWIDTAKKEKTLEEGLEYFYDKTGVQPYLIIMGEEGKDYVSEGSIEKFSQSLYDDLFGDDGGHIIVVFREYPNSSSNFICGVYAGSDAETVMDEQAREIFLDYIDYCYANESYDDAEFFANAFIKSADRIMKKQLSTTQVLVIIAVVFVLAAGGITIALIIKIRKEKAAKQNADQARAEANKVKTEFAQQQYKDKLETQYVSVVCPNCGSTSNKILKASIANCPFCGSAIKVDQSGKAFIIKPEDQ